MSEHELPEPRTAVLYDVWGVYKDYDGLAPDTAVLVWCATEELAKEVCRVFKKADDGEKPVFEGEVFDLGLPFVDGFESAAYYSPTKVAVSESEKHWIATTLEDACGNLNNR